jgi:hypothetical protein
MKIIKVPSKGYPSVTEGKVEVFFRTQWEMIAYLSEINLEAQMN